MNTGQDAGPALERVRDAALARRKAEHAYFNDDRDDCKTDMKLYDQMISAKEAEDEALAAVPS